MMGIPTIHDKCVETKYGVMKPCVRHTIFKNGVSNLAFHKKCNRS